MLHIICHQINTNQNHSERLLEWPKSGTQSVEHWQYQMLTRGKRKAHSLPVGMQNSMKKQLEDSLMVP